MLVKLLLKFFVSVVDAQLLEGVLCEDLEAEYVQEAYKSGLVHLASFFHGCFGRALRLFSRASGHGDGLVNLLDDPTEDDTVEVLT